MNCYFDGLPCDCGINDPCPKDTFDHSYDNTEIDYDEYDFPAGRGVHPSFEEDFEAIFQEQTFGSSLGG